jgi:hypothetical protein
MARDDGGVTADRAFSLLSDETRIAILQALWEAPSEGVTFTDLRAMVGNPNSGQFNYHLGKLRGQFVQKHDDEYGLTQAGRDVVRAVAAGTLTDRSVTDPRRIDGDCVACGGVLTVRYDEYATVACGDCGETVMWNEFPPAGLDGRSAAEVARAFDRWTRNRFDLAMAGICPTCASTMTSSLDDTGDGRLWTDHACGTCRYEARVPLYGHVVGHPAFVSWFYERGVDVTDLPYWELQALAQGFEERVHSSSPWAATVTAELDGDYLRFTLDEAFAVTDVERSGD